RKPPEQARLDAIRGCSAELAEVLDLADGFADLIRKRSSATLSEWLARGEASSDPDLRRFAEGIRRDEASVHAAVTERWSNGPVEGHVNRLKTIKRQMYGRAGFVLLRAREEIIGASSFLFPGGPGSELGSLPTLRRFYSLALYLEMVKIVIELTKIRN